MSRTCPSCAQPLPDSETGVEQRFCMYCGARLSPSSVHDALPADFDGSETQLYLPDPVGSANLASDATSTYMPGATRLRTAAPKLTAVAGYNILGFLGAGGMGTVYEAESRSTGARVAVKVLSGKLASNPSSVERFKQEGRVASLISHPHCVFVLGADTDAGRPFIVMELMPGRTLKDLVDARGPLPVSDAIGRILDVIDGLAEAHRQGVIHRDVKPSNCFLTEDDRVKVGDFGLSKSLTPDDESLEELLAGSQTGAEEVAARNLTTSGAFLGTVMYASPEQIRGESVGYDSDVYAVAATLYFLLTGRAPFQHESLTASLAKAVSEPPPRIRPVRPDVPRELERVVLRGLERDRSRRFPTLVALRDALMALRSDLQKPARPGALVLAYLADSLIVGLAELLLILPLLGHVGLEHLGEYQISLVTLVSIFYYWLFESLLGTTPGKRLLRLQVVRLNGVSPPGLGRGLVRTLVWQAVWLVPALIAHGVAPYARLPEALAAVAATAVSLVFAAPQLRRTAHGWRGFHDLASGCRVIQRERPPHRPHLRSRHPNPLDAAKPSPTPAPALVGGFAVAGKLSDLDGGSEVWLADDRALGRRVLLHVLPAGAPAPEAPDEEVTRPTRLRVLSRGQVAWPGATPAARAQLRHYVATVAPGGAPLLDLVAPDKPLGWADCRSILEQLADELATSRDERGEFSASLAQVWVEPNGRPQVVEFPLPYFARGKSVAPPPSAPLDLIRQAATLMLEGRPRASGDRVAAPLPVHASRITDALFAPAGAGYAGLEELREDLADDELRPAEVTPGLRRAHLGLWVPLAMWGAAWALTLSGLMTFFVAFGAAAEGGALARLRAALADAAQREELREEASAAFEARKQEAHGGQSRPPMLELTDPARLARTLGDLDEAVAVRRRASARHVARLNRAERWVFGRLGLDDPNWTPPGGATPPTPESVARMARRAGDILADPDERRGSRSLALPLACVMPLAVWAALAFVLRGGAALSVAGIAHVRLDGSRAPRWKVAVRELAVWAPFVGLCLLSLWLQLAHGEWVALRTGITLAAAATLPAMAVVALRYPARPPQDWLLGLALVPR